MKLRKTNKVGVFGMCLMALVACHVWASEGDCQGEQYKLEEVVVTATRVETPKEEIAANVTVVTSDDIKKMPVSSVGEVLQYVPGTYVEFNGGLGSQATATIQGSQLHQVAVYQDGVPLNQLANPLTDLSYIPVDMIDRIEVYKGAASSAWGSALGGVINIITKEPDPKKPFAGDLRTSYGEHATFKNRATVSGSGGRFGCLLSMTHEQSDGFMAHSEYDQSALYGKINYELGETSRLNLVYSYDKGNNSDPLPYEPDFWDDIYGKRVYQRLLFETTLAEGLDLTLEGRHHRFISIIEDVYSHYRDLYHDYEDEIWGVSARVSHHAHDWNRFNLGFDGDWGTYDFLSQFVEYDARGENWALYANDTLSLGDVSLNVGLRYDEHSDFGSELSPSAGLVYRILGDRARIRGQVSKGFSAPPAVWRDMPVYGNEDLKPEVAINYQGGVEASPFPFLRLALNFFRATVDDLIRYDWDAEMFENIAEVTRKGIEGSISASFDFGLSLSFGGSYVKVVDKTTDKVIRDIPPRLYNVSVSYANDRMTHSVVGNYVYHHSSYPETKDKVFIFDYLLKLKLSSPDRFGDLTLFAAVYNLGNSNYLYREVWPQPGRWIEGGIRVAF
ncbi:MAG: TonB-dependent receptor [Thermodesulfobacteriota bacterium]|nr:TonB-dependent receptor [Thermodesulfobacteriota bacterium]